MCPFKKLLRDLSRLDRIALISNVVALKNSTRAVACDFHDHGLSNAGPSKISDCPSRKLDRPRFFGLVMAMRIHEVITALPTGRSQGEELNANRPEHQPMVRVHP